MTIAPGSMLPFPREEHLSRQARLRAALRLCAALITRLLRRPSTRALRSIVRLAADGTSALLQAVIVVGRTVPHEVRLGRASGQPWRWCGKS